MRPLRAMFFSNNGIGAGHLARSLAIVKALRRQAEPLELMVATSSEADGLLGAQRVAAVRWPAPEVALSSGWSDEQRRDVAAHVVSGAIEAFNPELLVTDTFPWGPHGELAGLVGQVPRRALIRRTLRPERAGDARVRAGLADYELAIVPDDPGEVMTESLPIPVVRVPPITLFEAHEAMTREAARAHLKLPARGRVIVVCSGGGGDPEAVAQASRIAGAIARIPKGPIAAIATGPLARRGPPALHPRIRHLEETPLQPLLAAFDGAIAPAGYNLAHELAKAGLPLALFSNPRPYDDQAARAARFEAAGLAQTLSTIDDASVAATVAWMARAPRPSLVALGALVGGGADRAADTLLRLVANQLDSSRLGAQKRGPEGAR